MSDDRFEPPRTPVADPTTPIEQAPVTVRNACGLVLLSVALGFVTLIPGIHPPQPEMSAGMLLFEALWVAFFSGLTYWLTLMLRRRRTWSRWAMLVLLATGWALLLMTLQEDFERSPIYVVIQLLSTFVEVWAVWLLFTGTSAKWFATR